MILRKLGYMLLMVAGGLIFLMGFPLAMVGITMLFGERSAASSAGFTSVLGCVFIAAGAVMADMGRNGLWGPGGGGTNRAGGELPVRTVNSVEEAATGHWFRLRKWDTRNYFMFKADPAPGWVEYSLYEPVAGVAHGNRQAAFLRIYRQREFRLYLQREPENPYDPHAIMVMGTATLKGVPENHHLGYIEKATAKKLARAGDLGAIPYGVWLPARTGNYGLRIVILLKAESAKVKRSSSKISPPLPPPLPS